jgi:hypothetical protein
VDSGSERRSSNVIFKSIIDHELGSVLDPTHAGMLLKQMYGTSAPQQVLAPLQFNPYYNRLYKLVNNKRRKLRGHRRHLLVSQLY